MLQKHLWVDFVLSGSCSGDSSVGLLYYMKVWVGLQTSSRGSPWWEGGLSSPVPGPHKKLGQVFHIWNTYLGSAPACKRWATWLIPASPTGVRASGAWQETTEKVRKQTAIDWWLVLGDSRWVTLLHFMVVLHLQVPAVSEIAWAGAVLYQFHSQQALQVKHFIVGIRLCFLLDSLK